MYLNILRNKATYVRGICKKGLEWQFESGMLNLTCHPAVKFFVLLISLFFLHSCTMVDGVMILPVLMMIAFPSPSMEGKRLTAVWVAQVYSRVPHGDVSVKDR